MKTQWNLTNLAALLLMVAGAFHSGPLMAEDKKSGPHREIPSHTQEDESAPKIIPAEINEAMTTWHLGQISLDIPERYEPNCFEFTFFPKIADAGKNGLTMVEISADKAADQLFGVTNDSLYTQERFHGTLFSDYLWWTKAQKARDVDISQELGYPAGLTVYHYVAIQGGGVEAFGFDILVKKGEALLKFEYIEELDGSTSTKGWLTSFVDRRKDDILPWLKGIVSAYQWTGNNAPPESKRLATKFGWLNHDGALAEEIIIISTSVLVLHKYMPEGAADAAETSTPLPPGDQYRHIKMPQGCCNNSFERIASRLYFTETESQGIYLNFGLSAVFDKKKPASEAESAPDKPENLTVADNVFLQKWTLNRPTAAYGSVPVSVYLALSGPKDASLGLAYGLGLAQRALNSIKAAN